MKRKEKVSCANMYYCVLRNKENTRMHNLDNAIFPSMHGNTTAVVGFRETRRK